MASEPVWKSLVDQLVDEGYESEYLTRLRETYDVQAPRESIEREILQEMAAALGRTEMKVNVKLLELEILGKRLESRPGRASALAYNQKRDEALRARRDLLIHRDALHFRRDRQLEQRYPVPSAVPVPDGPPPKAPPAKRPRWPWSR
ncbi:MAG: hypothetical protein AB8I08_27965 [Sandaracinaceae bacterium]